MAMAMGGGGASAPQMNVTQLIDVLLVLIFMLIVTQSQQKGLETQIPQPPSERDSAPEIVRTVVIQLGNAKSTDVPVLKINQKEIEWPELKLELLDIFKCCAEKVAFVQGDDEVNFEYVADVIDTAHNAGVERVGLLPKEMAAIH